jgi:hypothetical protein
MQPGPKIELAAERLGEDIGQWVVALRNDDRSWRYIADKLAEKTNVVITYAWLRRVFRDAAEIQQDAA